MPTWSRALEGGSLAATAVLEDRRLRSQAATQPVINPAEAEAVDPQFVELFIEEAKEEITSIQRAFPLWDQNPMDLESLASLRRSFHTLKGSGRMVGARLVAEFSWAIENLLNRIIDKTLSRTPAMMGLLRNAVATLPQLVHQLEHGGEVSIEPLMSRAFAYADGREADQAPPAEDRDVATTSFPAAGSGAPTLAIAPKPTPVQAPPAAAAEPPAAAPTMVIAPPPVPAPPVTADVASMDPQLHEIYSKEVSSHLTEIRAYLRKRSGLPAPHELPESVYRAIHTLSGSSKMAEARHGIRITEPLNHYMRKVFDSGLGISDAALAVLSDAVRAIDNVVSHINESSAFFAEQPSLLERLQVLEARIDAELANVIETSASALVPQLAQPEVARAPRGASAGAGGRRPPRRRMNSITRSPISTARRQPS